MNSVLRDIPGYEGLYAVTRDGRVWSHSRVVNRAPSTQRFEGRWIRSCIPDGRYPCVRLYIAGKGKTERLHRLVALAWLPNPARLPEPNHKDGDKTNPHVDNLEWCTRAHNSAHAWQAGLNRFTEVSRAAARRNVAKANEANERRRRMSRVA